LARFQEKQKSSLKFGEIKIERVDVMQGLMNICSFQNTLEFDYNITFNERIKNLNGSHNFFYTIIAKISKAIEENNFIRLTKERYQGFINYKHKQILADGDSFTLYRIAGKLYLNRKIEEFWEVARIY